ncbi:MAG: polymerase III subunit beta protein [Candidatus Woesebacteria bacterium GW2011_GWA1_39_21]|uniref:Beta sliding clamp n=1 Tax=Candidatus Woesebacteria bacterium GW2011_GWA1_39_21 TaxID=1618550 RepID=A0A0G0NEP0_9BACT|nr:MAG: polymerase III subunit beta protein [Candidatus Woesebacteria bacterium GW2011_GWA1_39_21]
MKLRVSRKSFFDALSITSRFTSYKAQLPILGNILLETKNNKLNISATNLEMSVCLAIAAKIESEGKITVPAKTIHDVASNLSGESVDLEVDKEQIFLKCGSFSSKLLGIVASDFPPIPASVSKNALEIPSETFLESLPKVLYCVSSDETRPTLTGVLMILFKDLVSWVATDGFRLSKKDMPMKESSRETKIIIPKGVLSELIRIAKEQKIVLDYKKDEKQIVFQVGEAVLSSRVIEGEFPDFEKIIPQTYKLKLDVDRNELSQAIKLASVFARDAANVVKFIISEKTFKLNAESSQSGDQENSLDVKIESKDSQLFDEKGEFVIAFNCKYVEDYLNCVEGENIEIKFNDVNSPGVFLDTSDEKLLHLIMPVRLQS